jgi:16S rRNA processing protein RimM
LNDDPMEKALVSIGKVIKPHGIKGKVKVEYFGQDPSAFRLYGEVLIRDRAGCLKAYEVLEAIPQPPRIILTLKGIEAIEDTQPLLAREIFVRREALPELEKDEFYWVDLLGIRVETEAGRTIGALKEIFPTGAHDVFVVAGRRGDIFLPATEEVIKHIDQERGVMKVRWMEGLWEAEDEV